MNYIVRKMRGGSVGAWHVAVPDTRLWIASCGLWLKQGPDVDAVKADEFIGSGKRCGKCRGWPS